MLKRLWDQRVAVILVPWCVVPEGGQQHVWKYRACSFLYLLMDLLLRNLLRYFLKSKIVPLIFHTINKEAQVWWAYLEVGEMPTVFGSELLNNSPCHSKDCQAWEGLRWREASLAEANYSILYSTICSYDGVATVPFKVCLAYWDANHSRRIIAEMPRVLEQSHVFINK